jgi:Protein of unknown function (DUF1566)
MKKIVTLLIVLLLLFALISCSNNAVNKSINNLPNISGYPIVSTNQTTFHDNNNEISAPTRGDDFYGQDSQYNRNEAKYQDNGDGTITDLVTGLMWAKSPDMDGDGDIDVDDKLTYREALDGTFSYNLGGHDDWHLPTIKELYSLIQFSGVDPSGYTGSDTDALIPFIDTNYFDFAYGDTNGGERIIDAQFASSNKYLDDDLLFGVNFADGRIKGYEMKMPFGHRGEKKFFVYYVRGNKTYGINDFVDNNDGTITDRATNLMWTADDNGQGINWKESLEYAENLEFGGHSDWRLPDAKELHSIVDYYRTFEITNSASINPLFNCTEITSETGEIDYGFYWSSTTHFNWSEAGATNACYLAFGRAMGYMNGAWQDVHGAGSQRSDPKVGSPDEYPAGKGPQGDAIRINNFVRCVRTVQ